MQGGRIEWERSGGDGRGRSTYDRPGGAVAGVYVCTRTCVLVNILQHMHDKMQ